MAYEAIWETDPSFYYALYGTPVYSDSDLTVTKSVSGSWLLIPSTKGRSSGKWYWEVKKNATDADSMLGIILKDKRGISTSSSIRIYLPNFASVLGMPNTNSDETGTADSTSFSGSLAVGEVMGFALDLDNFKLFVRVPAGWCLSGDPVAGTDPVFWNLSELQAWYPYLYSSNGSGQADVTLNAGDSAFTYTIPTGYNPLNVPGQIYNAEITATSLSVDTYERIGEYNVEITATTKGIDGNETPGFIFGGVNASTGSINIITAPSPSYGDITASTGSSIIVTGANLTDTILIETETGAVIEAWNFTGKLTESTGSYINIDGELIKAFYPYDGYIAVDSTTITIDTITLAVEGSLEISLLNIIALGYGGATGAITLPLIDCNGTGLLGITGSWNESLSLLECSGTGIISILGELQENLFLLNCAGISALGITGSVTVNLLIIEAEATGYASGTGDTAITLPMIECYGTGKIEERFDDTILRHSRWS